MSKFSTLFFIALMLSAHAFAQDWAALPLTQLYRQIPGTRTFTFAFENIDNTGISPYTIGWQQDNGPIHSLSKLASNTYWTSGGGLIADPTMTVTFPTTGVYKLKAWVKVPNDLNPANDTITANITVYEALPKKNVVLEIYKHLTCGPCYAIAQYADTCIAKNDAYSLVSIYAGITEPFAIPEGVEADDALVGGTHPGPVFDRYKFNFFKSFRASYYATPFSIDGYGERERYFERVQVYFKSVNYNSATRELKMKLAAKAWVGFSEELRFNVYLTEDSVKGYQAAAPDPANYYHNHVLRAMLGGAWGKAGSIPSSMSKNDEAEYDFTYTVPSNYNTSKMHLIALVQAYDQNIIGRRIVNSEHKTFAEALDIKDATPAANLQFNVYPNPATDVLKISFGTALPKPVELTLEDIAGRVYGTQQVQADAELNLQHLAPGTYLLRIDDGQVVHTHNVIKQ
ncbi:Omp28-related outer membrane protein [Polluticoccus soli]|uniref:Omp28-related outer membrane protein n=1 Tax=Polluticoccus soli TaxID=3034150 RepID=UPI0023E3326E|nr:Omp28-related outer membrane protein [Flavipsychrobacter sp. JY13-12]